MWTAGFCHRCWLAWPPTRNALPRVYVSSSPFVRVGPARSSSSSASSGGCCRQGAFPDTINQTEVPMKPRLVVTWALAFSGILAGDACTAPNEQSLVIDGVFAPNGGSTEGACGASEFEVAS